MSIDIRKKSLDADLIESFCADDNQLRILDALMSTTSSR